MKQYHSELGEDTAVTAREVVTTPGLYFLVPPLSCTTGSQIQETQGNILQQMCSKLRTEESGSLLIISTKQGSSGTEWVLMAQNCVLEKISAWTVIGLPVVKWLFDSLFASIEYSSLCAEISDGEEIDLLCHGTSRRNF